MRQGFILLIAILLYAAGGCARGVALLVAGPQVQPGEGPLWFYSPEKIPDSLHNRDSVIIKVETVYPFDLERKIQDGVVGTIVHLFFSCESGAVISDKKHTEDLDTSGAQRQRFAGEYYENGERHTLTVVRLAFPAEKFRELVRNELVMLDDKSRVGPTTECLQKKGLI